MNILDTIDSTEDIKKLEVPQLKELSLEIREFLLENVAKTGGHLASNLGLVETTLAIHRVFDTAVDRLVFDVGHQCYVHKILTGRKERFSTLRCLDGLSGFPKPEESIHDAAIAGHASSSVSVALGMARARSLKDEDYNVLALIGDGALTGGLAYEGLCNAGSSGEPIIVILNDNGMSIDSNVGGISRLLSKQRVKPAYFKFKRRYRRLFSHFPALYRFNHRIKEWFKRILIPGTMFSDLGFHYLGPVDGHDLVQLEAVLRWAKELKEPVLVHVVTQKGKGYELAEKNPEAYHGVGSFDKEKGVDEGCHKDFSAAFGDSLTELAEKDEGIVSISAAMCAGTGLSAFAEKYPDRFFDVGIAEGHAAAMAAGLAKQGLKPVFAVYSTFLQRSFDMLIHDIALSGLHVVLAVDRAGIVGRDGETHQGVFDVSYLACIPRMAVMCPASYKELSEMLNLALYKIDGPVALRYPRGCEGEYSSENCDAATVILQEGEDITLVAYGTMINKIIEAGEILAQGEVSAEIIKLNMINPIDKEKILESLAKTGRLLCAEDVCAHGSIGSRLLEICARQGLCLKGSKTLNLGNGIVRQGEPEELLSLYGLDGEAIAFSAIELIAETMEEAGETAEDENEEDEA